MSVVSLEENINFWNCVFVLRVKTPRNKGSMDLPKRNIFNCRPEMCAKMLNSKENSRYVISQKGWNYNVQPRKTIS